MRFYLTTDHDVEETEARNIDQTIDCSNCAAGLEVTLELPKVPC